MADPELLRSFLGKWGYTLYTYANGMDQSPVKRADAFDRVKSISNSTTPSRDLQTQEDVRTVFYLLSESVARRMREKGLKCGAVGISVRDRELHVTEWQAQLREQTDLSQDIAKSAIALFNAHYDWRIPVRSLGVAAFELREEVQLTLFHAAQKERQEQLECALDNIRSRFGTACVRRALLLRNRDLMKISLKQYF